jgi:hypothetical protein
MKTISFFRMKTYFLLIYSKLHKTAASAGESTFFWVVSPYERVDDQAD